MNSPLEEALARRVLGTMEGRAGLELHWASDPGSPLPRMRIAGLDRDHGIDVVLTRRNFSVSAELEMEKYAGDLLRLVGDHVTSDREMWRGLFDEGRERGQQLSMFVNGEPCATVDDLPDDTWKTLEFEASTRLAPFRGNVELAMEDVLTTSLSLILAGIDPNPSDETVDEQVEHLGRLEGAAQRVVATRYERNRANRLRCIRHYGSKCWVCDFDFAERYGPAGQGLIVVHHVIPVSQLGPGYRLNPLRDLVPLCDNCHRMVHTQEPPISPEDLRGSLCLEPKPARG